ncbi:MAG TPA: hypothetical protein VE344_10115 [Methylomirabilota bacterium]|nr:hypothetical protein [Methylomirabilota bacterium]
MPKSYYLPSDDAGRLTWLNNFSAKLPVYSAPLGLLAADTASVQADAAFFNYAFGAQQQIAAYAQQWTAYKNAARDGSGPSLGAAPAAPALGVAPTAVAPGIIGRVKALVARIKVAPGYTDSIGQALQIIGADQTVDVNSMKPVLTAELDAGAVNLGWMKQGMDGIEFQVDRGAGFVFLAIDTIPNYTDTAAMPAAGQSALWKYKAIYIQADQRVGQWSDVVSIPVAG